MNETIVLDKHEMVIDRDEYEDLISDKEFLEKLHQAGVDNWEGYSCAQDND